MLGFLDTLDENGYPHSDEMDVIWRTSTGKMVKATSTAAKWLCRCEQVCKTMQQLAQAHKLWSKLAAEAFPHIKPAARCKDRFKAWRQLYYARDSPAPLVDTPATFSYGYRACVELYQPLKPDEPEPDAHYPLDAHMVFTCSLRPWSDSLVRCCPLPDEIRHYYSGDDDTEWLDRSTVTWGPDLTSVTPRGSSAQYVWPPLVGEVFIERSDGKVARLGSFDLSTPHCYENGVSPACGQFQMTSGVNDPDSQSLHQIVIEPAIEPDVYGQIYFLANIDIHYPSRTDDLAFVSMFELDVIQSLLPPGELPTVSTSERFEEEPYARPVMEMLHRMRFY